MLNNGWLGRYRIVNKIGSGGMGEVYLAKDSRLSREAALKTLPADVAADSDRMARFMHEAKTASALNHPNIITIYEINDEGETPYIAMEYVPGETLAKAIRTGRLTLHNIIDIATQVSGALLAAHEAGVVHRDVKPDNIIIRPDGLVKVLDFGLAKLTENNKSDPEAETIAHRTNPGMILGTASYMSPEQARAKDLDGRSDIFSLGVLLYQMLTGQMPFSGDNYIDVIGSILHKEPRPIHDIDPTIPHEIESLVRKCLRKDRDERYQSIRELLADLKEIRLEFELDTRSGNRVARASNQELVPPTDETAVAADSTSGRMRVVTGAVSTMVVEGLRQHPLRAFTALAATIGLFFAAGLGVNSFVASSSSPTPFQSMRMSRVTTTGNLDMESFALAPEGKLIAYVVSESAKQSLWLKHASAESGIELVPPADVSYSGLAFSPDAAFIYFSMADALKKPAIYQVALGSQPRKILDDADGPIAVSPDGKRIAYVYDETSLMVANIDGSQVRILNKSTDGKRWIRLAWTPDGKSITAVYFSDADNFDHIAQIDSATGEESPFPMPPWLRVRGVAWMPDKSGVVISGRDADLQHSQLWFIGYPDGQVHRITNDLSHFIGAAVSADGKTLASIQMHNLVNIWLMPGQENGGITQLTDQPGRDEGMSGISLAPDGAVIYTVRVGNGTELWEVRPGGTSNRRLFHDSVNTAENFAPVVSPDNKYIVFASTRSGDGGLWRVNRDGTNLVQLTTEPGLELEPSFTPDGRWVLYNYKDEKNVYSIRKIGTEGGNPVQLTGAGFRKPVVSPDGKYFASEYADDGLGYSVKLAITPIDGGEPFRILDLPIVVRSRIYRWSSDGKSIVYTNISEDSQNLWKQPLDGGSPEKITDLSVDRIIRFDIAADGKTFVFSRGKISADVVAISNFN